MNNIIEPLFDVIHHGAINGVTGSCHELCLADASSVLIDCGLFQGVEIALDKSSFEQLQITFPVQHIRALIITHVHIDHVGRIPYLLAAGFSGPIYCSKPSALLLPTVLEDAFKMGISRDRHLLKQYLSLLKKRIIPLDYDQWFDVAPYENDANTTHLRIKLKPAGHIIGSAYVECNIQVQHDKQRVVFSGDLGAPYSPLLPAPQSPYRADFLVLESTYGDHNHPSRRARYQQLKKIIEHAFKNKGVLLIPAFSIGRTQEILYELEQIIFENRKAFIRQNIKWDDLEVVVDSPMAADFTQMYRQLRSYWDKEAKRRLKNSRHPLAFEQLITIDDHSTHLQTVEYLAKTKRPTIVISASGMCSGGRVVNYLKAILEDDSHDILFTGYQAQGTPGRAIQHYGPKGGYVELDGKRYPIKAQVHTISAYSAHADQSDLIRFTKRMHHKPKEIRLVHGDKEAKQALKEKLEANFDNMVVS